MILLIKLVLYLSKIRQAEFLQHLSFNEKSPDQWTDKNKKTKTIYQKIV